jgi:hypothetical protein
MKMNPTLMMILIGLGIVGTMVLAASFLGAGRREAFLKATFAWLVGAGVNAWMNVSGGAPLMDEISNFVLIFGIPAAGAYALSRLVKEKLKKGEGSVGD